MAVATVSSIAVMSAEDARLPSAVLNKVIDEA
jgi:hypothetical protein